MKEVNKQQPYIRRKPIKNQINRQIKFSNISNELVVSPTELRSLKLKIKQNDSSSFISNKHDGSMDSMDKIIIGVAAMGIDQKQFEEQSEKQQRSKQSVIDYDFTEIHKQYEKLIGKKLLLGEQQEQQISESIQQNSRVLPDQYDEQSKQMTIQKRLSLSLSPKKQLYSQNQIKLQIQKILRQDQLKPKKSQDISNNSIKILVGNLGNLSQIHQEKQNLLNTSVDTDRKRNNQEDQQQFIDFVRQPDPTQNNQVNQKKHQFSDQHQVNQWLATPMLQNLQLQLQKQKDSKKVQKTENYQQILSALNSKQEQQTHSDVVQILRQRQEWIKSHSQKSQNWRKKQLKLLSKMKKIMKNPQYDSSDSEQ